VPSVITAVLSSQALLTKKKKKREQIRNAKFQNTGPKSYGYRTEALKHTVRGAKASTGAGWGAEAPADAARGGEAPKRAARGAKASTGAVRSAKAPAGAERGAEAPAVRGTTGGARGEAPLPQPTARWLTYWTKPPGLIPVATMESLKVLCEG